MGSELPKIVVVPRKGIVEDKYRHKQLIKTNLVLRPNEKPSISMLDVLVTNNNVKQYKGFRELDRNVAIGVESLIETPVLNNRVTMVEELIRKRELDKKVSSKKVASK